MYVAQKMLVTNSVKVHLESLLVEIGIIFWSAVLSSVVILSSTFLFYEVSTQLLSTKKFRLLITFVSAACKIFYELCSIFSNLSRINLSNPGIGNVFGHCFSLFKHTAYYNINITIFKFTDISATPFYNIINETPKNLMNSYLLTFFLSLLERYQSWYIYYQDFYLKIVPRIRY